mmetsp:Transcript_47667/g.102041  ORF Transcript_47667/g.102041 Transcript_47667/m.102041 type:complete len:318 (-) Transcript_47667:103-1056(-)
MAKRISWPADIARCSFLFVVVAGSSVRSPVASTATNAKLGSLMPPAANIPNTIFLAGPWKPDDTIINNRKFVPHGTQFRYYDYEKVDKSAKDISDNLESLGVHGAYAALQQLRPWSFRIDLWRFMILWQHGGVYLDSKVMLWRNISDWVDLSSDDFVACYDPSSPPGKKDYGTPVLAARQESPIMLAAIRQVVANIETRYYGPRKGRYPPSHPNPQLCITGPCALTQAIEEGGFHPHVTCQQEDWDDSRADFRFVSLGPEPVTLMVFDKTMHNAMRTCRNCNSYEYVFLFHAVYCDEPTILPDEADPCLKADRQVGI